MKEGLALMLMNHIYLTTRGPNITNTKETMYKNYIVLTMLEFVSLNDVQPNIVVSKAVMMDTGNLVLLNATNRVLWQSFDTPTNTLLPGQLYSASSNMAMYAWQDSGTWTQSRYYLNWSSDGTLGGYYQPPFANHGSIWYVKLGVK